MVNVSRFGEVFAVEPPNMEERNHKTKLQACVFFLVGLISSKIIVAVLFLTLWLFSGLHIRLDDTTSSKLSFDREEMCPESVPAPEKQVSHMDASLFKCKQDLEQKKNETSCKLYDNMDIYGYNLEWRYSSKDECCQLCHKHPVCKAWSWEGGEGGKCYLKSVTGPLTKKDGVYSGVLPTYTSIRYKNQFKCMSENSTPHCTLKAYLDQTIPDQLNEYLEDQIIRHSIIKHFNSSLFKNTASDGSGRNRHAICQHVAMKLSTSCGGTWGCVMGTNFSSHFGDDEQVRLKFMLDNDEVVEIFQSKSKEEMNSMDDDTQFWVEEAKYVARAIIIDAVMTIVFA